MIRLIGVIAALFLSLSVSATHAEDGRSHVSKAALQAYFDTPDKGREVFVWRDVTAWHVEIATDYGLGGTQPLKPDKSDPTELWDALFLLKYFVKADFVDTDRFRRLYPTIARRVLSRYSSFPCPEKNDGEKPAICILGLLAEQHSLTFYTVSTDEGYRCLSPLSKDFKTTEAPQKCVNLLKGRR